MRYLISLFLAFIGLMSAPLAQAQDLPRTIIVMDGSGSMWGQIEGKPKLVIARETVAEVLRTIPPGQELGLLAYGHRVKGDCGDIELVVPPSAGTAGQIIDSVNAMRFLGKTPLSDAVLQAAEALRYSEAAATVVLVTDGLETCDADPCALGIALEAAGLNFTTHVIGFGLTEEEGAQVACLAENTGGRYFAADDSGGLIDALVSSVASAAGPEAAAEVLPEATITAPAQAIVGSIIDIKWTGPNGHLDAVEIGLPGEGAGRFYVYTASGNPVQLQMPAEPADYELRYKQGDHTVLTSRAIAVIEAQVSLDAPPQVHAGSEIAVAWTGPDAELDTIVLRLPGDDSYITYAYVRGGNPASIGAPEEPGSYELAYRLNDSEVLATRAIEVVPIGADIVGSGDTALVLEEASGSESAAVRISGATYDGMFKRWTATRLDGGDAAVIDSGAYRPRWWETELPIGTWQVEGTAEGAARPLFAGQIVVAAGGASEFRIPLAGANPPAAGGKVKGDGAVSELDGTPIEIPEGIDLRELLTYTAAEH